MTVGQLGAFPVGELVLHRTSFIRPAQLPAGCFADLMYYVHVCDCHVPISSAVTISCDAADASVASTGVASPSHKIPLSWELQRL